VHLLAASLHAPDSDSKLHQSRNQARDSVWFRGTRHNRTVNRATGATRRGDGAQHHDNGNGARGYDVDLFRVRSCQPGALCRRTPHARREPGPISEPQPRNVARSVSQPARPRQHLPPLHVCRVLRTKLPAPTWSSSSTDAEVASRAGELVFHLVSTTQWQLDVKLAELGASPQGRSVLHPRAAPPSTAPQSFAAPREALRSDTPTQCIHRYLSAQLRTASMEFCMRRRGPITSQRSPLLAAARRSQQTAAARNTAQIPHSHHPHDTQTDFDSALVLLVVDAFMHPPAARCGTSVSHRAWRATPVSPAHVQYSACTVGHRGR
jgi:hypothetical protein